MENSDLYKQFLFSSEAVKLLPTKPCDDILLDLYSLYKQSTIGDCNTSQPGGLFNMKEKAKWNSWNKIKGTNRETAMKMYIDIVTNLMNS